MTATVLTFPKAPKQPPDTVRLGYDFSEWCAEFYRGDRFRQRVTFHCLDDARAEVERQERRGLRRLPDARPGWTEAAYGALSDGDPDDWGGAA